MAPAGITEATLTAISGVIIVWFAGGMIMGGMAAATYNFLDRLWGEQAAQRKIEKITKERDNAIRERQELRRENQELRSQIQGKVPGDHGTHYSGAP